MPIRQRLHFWAGLALAGVLVCTGSPGASASEAGASLFRVVVGADGSVPFPLPRLLERIRAELDPMAEFGGLPLVLIPLGRSLQRHAAGDDGYFRYPRVVVAVTGEPRDTLAPLLRDRLFLGYHEKAGVLEVISYNPGGGRFEFEVVDDYRAGATPRLRAGNRQLCLGCHQNAAPIFSRQTWDETSASPPVAALLALAGRDFYGLDWRRGVDVANAIDDATDRANRLSLAQRAWREGCGDRPGGDDCRARLLWLAVRSKLTGVPVADHEYEDPALAPLAAAWQLGAWSMGLEVPNPDIPNRLPFAGLPEGTVPLLDRDTMRRLADVSAEFDALAERPPLLRLAGGKPAHLARLVDALGEFLARTDLAAIEATLAGRPAPLARTLVLDCDRRAAGAREDFACSGERGVTLAARSNGERLRIDRIVLPAGEVHYGLDFERDGRAFVPSGKPVREAGGARLGEIAIDGERMRIRLDDDLRPLAVAIERLANEKRTARSPAWSAARSLGRDVIAAVLDEFGIASWRRAAGWPALPQQGPSGRAATDPELAPLHRHCGACHDVPDAFPPGFLHGDLPEIRSRVDACASRMLQRIAMWAASPERRSKVPMPPPVSPQAAALRGSNELAAMSEWLSGRVRAQGMDPARVLAGTYADLPPCASY